MIATFLATAGQHGIEHQELPMPAYWYGVIALGSLLALLAVTFAFRSVGTRH